MTIESVNSSPEIGVEPRKANSAWRGILNLLAFGLLVALALVWVIRYRNCSELAAATKLALSALHGPAPAPTLDGTHPCMLTVLSGGEEEPVLTRCATPTTHNAGFDQFEVDLRYGAFVLRQTDLEVKDVFDVPLTRSYDAQDWLPLNKMHAFGRNSSHPFDVAPLGTRNPYTHMMLTLEDGDFLYFKRISKGTGYANAVYQHTETSTRFYKSTINWNGDGWTLRMTNGEEMYFPEAYSSKNMAQCAAMEIRDSEGDKLELKRDRQRNLLEILTPHAHWIKFSYDDQARITRAEDDVGHWTNYTYNYYGMLTDVLHSSGEARHYDYQKSLLSAILDGQGHVLVRNHYTGKVLTAQVYPNGDIYRFKYFWSSNRNYAVKTIITMPNGSRREVEPADSVPGYLRK